MKFHHILVSLFIIISFPLFPAVSNSALQPSSTRVYPTDAALTELFSVAVAKEPIYLILVEKNLQRLRVLEYDDELRVVAEYPSATGENFGIKEISGDAKTPEGIYFITQIFRDDKITIFGDKAFHLDYPNFFDQEAGRNGDGIYIHGTNKELKLNSTNGCVTLANDDLDDLENYLNQAVTPVVIVQELDTLTKSKIHFLTENDFSLAKSLLLTEEIKPDNVEYNYLYIISFGDQTVAVSDFSYRPSKRSIMRGESRTYLEYFPEQGWTARKRIWRVSPLQIYPDAPVKIAAHPLTTGEVQLAEQSPEEAEAMMAALNPQIARIQNPVALEKSPPKSQVTTKPQAEVKEKSEPTETAVPPVEIAQQLKPLPAATTPATPAPQKIAAAKIEQSQKIMTSIPVAPRNDQQIADFVENWRQAWESRQITPYISFYDESFRSGDKNLPAWKAHKEKLNQTYKEIQVNVSDIKVQWTAEGVSVSFRQEYRSDLYRAKGIKTLDLVNNGLGWKIKREVFSRN